jgi:hypothetical protein
MSRQVLPHAPSPTTTSLRRRGLDISAHRTHTRVSTSRNTHKHGAVYGRRCEMHVCARHLAQCSDPRRRACTAQHSTAHRRGKEGGKTCHAPSNQNSALCCAAFVCAGCRCSLRDTAPTTGSGIHISGAHTCVLWQEKKDVLVLLSLPRPLNFSCARSVLCYSRRATPPLPTNHIAQHLL